MANTAWQTPLGEVAADAELATRLLDRFPALEEDSGAHRSEHAIEVQLPFLQAQQPKLKIVPIAIGTRDFDVLRGLGGRWRRRLQIWKKAAGKSADHRFQRHEPLRVRGNHSVQRWQGY